MVPLLLVYCEFPAGSGHVHPTLGPPAVPGPALISGHPLPPTPQGAASDNTLTPALSDASW